MNPIISVIIPVYNVENYLRCCVDSVLAQTFQEYEILLVDDGSKDSSGKICDDYAQNNNKICVIHKSNQGPSHTRNVGIENAKGEYVYFLDSDDYIIPECLEILYANIVKYNADLSCGSFRVSDVQHPIITKAFKTGKITKRNGKEACRLLLYGKDYYTSSCNILIKTDIARKQPFPVGKFHEDEMTTFRYFLEASLIVKTNIATYYYYQREGSIMHTFGQPVIDEAEAGDYYVEVCGRINKELLKAALCKKFFLYVEIIENYPQIQYTNNDLYDHLISYIKKKQASILFDADTPFYIKKIILKHLTKKKTK